MKQAIIESRPYLLTSLLFGISYYFVKESAFPGTYLMLWKGAGVTFLAVYAFVRLHRIDGKILGAIMSLGAIGDMVIEIDMIAGAVVFLAGHLVAIFFYSRFRRHKLAFSQKIFVFSFPIIVTVIAWSISGDFLAAVYCLIAAAMTSMAWSSRFPRYRVGIGALLFVISDILIVGRMGTLEASALPDLFVWPLYYFGQFLIATGVVATLRHEMASESADI